MQLRDICYTYGRPGPWADRLGVSPAGAVRAVLHGRWAAAGAGGASESGSKGLAGFTRLVPSATLAGRLLQLHGPVHHPESGQARALQGPLWPSPGRAACCGRQRLRLRLPRPGAHPAPAGTLPPVLLFLLG